MLFDIGKCTNLDTWDFSFASDCKKKHLCESPNPPPSYPHQWQSVKNPEQSPSITNMQTGPLSLPPAKQTERQWSHWNLRHSQQNWRVKLKYESSDGVLPTPFEEVARLQEVVLARHRNSRSTSGCKQILGLEDELCTCLPFTADSIL